MIVAGTSPLIWIDLDRDEPGMILQQHKPGDRWRDYLVDGQVVRSPVDIAKLPPGRYRLVD